MDSLKLIKPSMIYAKQIEEYRAEFPSERMRVTLDPDRIPGLDHLENFASIAEWLSYCESMAGKITWFMSVRESDGKVVGFSCLRHSLEYDDDDLDFASNIGYSVRPSERKQGYAKEQLRLLLGEAKALGMESVRIVCRDINEGSNRTILACGGKYVDSLYGEESGITINRYDVRLGTMTDYKYITLREAPELMRAAAEWFSSKWNVPKDAYLACMDTYLKNETEYGWYLCLCGDKLVGGLGVIENDFHDRKDLAPNICAVYTEEAHRRQGIAGYLLNMAVDDLRAKGISPVYLLTDHTEFYERYGWEFLCFARSDGEENLSRMYIH